MSEKRFCPCCGRHCDSENLHCRRGEEYFLTGVIPESDHSHGRGHNHGHSNSEKYAAEYRTMDTNNKLIINLRDLGHMLRFLFEGKGSQKRILIILNEVESITQNKLTERLGIKPGSASEVISKLESGGLIERTPSVTDRRTIDIRLTEAGKLQAEEAAQNREDRHSEMFSSLTDEEKEKLLSLLEKVNSDWKQRYNEHKELFDHEKHHKGHKHGGAHNGRAHHKH